MVSQKLGKNRWGQGLCPLLARYLRKEELELPEADPGLPLWRHRPGGAGLIHMAKAGQTFNREDLKLLSNETYIKVISSAARLSP